jgi:hypothetical protein
MVARGTHVGTDVWLVWYTIDEDAPVVARNDVVDACARFGMPTGPLSRRNRVQSFRAVAEGTVLGYRDGSGQEWTITARAGKEVKESHVGYEAVRDDGHRMAQVKLFLPRRVESGVIPNSHRVKWLVRSNMDAADTAAAQEWCHSVEEAFALTQGEIDSRVIRRIVKASLERTCVPVYRRWTTLFAYADALPTVESTRAFVDAVVANSEVVTLPLADSALPGLVASADVASSSEMEHLVDTIESWVSRPAARNHFKIALLDWQREAAGAARRMRRHEQRLGSELSGARRLLAMAEEMTTALESSAHLLPASGR